MQKYPECEKWRMAEGKDVIFEFLEWLPESGYKLIKNDSWDRVRTLTYDQMVMKFYGVDQDLLDYERDLIFKEWAENQNNE